VTVHQEWQTAPLGEVADIVMGQSPDSSLYSEEEIGFPFLQGCAEFGGKSPRHKLFCSQKRKLARAGSILFSVRAPVGKLNIADRDYVIGRGLASISGKTVITEYLEHFLRLEEGCFRTASQGSTFEAINSNELEQWPIFHPTCRREQKKIAEIISTVGQVTEKTEALIAKQQRIKIGLMQNLLTCGIDEHGNLRSEKTHKFKDSLLGRIPEEWITRSLDEILILKQYGISTGLTEDQAGVPVLRMNNLVDGEINYSELKYSNESTVLKSMLDDGDVLFNRTNSIDYVGRTAIYRHRETPVSFASYLVRLVPDPTTLLPEYLNLWLNDAVSQVRVKQLATIGVQQANINPTNLGALTVAIPGSLDEQRVIVGAVLACAGQITKTRQELDKLASIKRALMQDLLTGSRRMNFPEHNIKVPNR